MVVKNFAIFRNFKKTKFEPKDSLMITKAFIPYSEALNLYCLLMCQYHQEEGIEFIDHKSPNKAKRQIVSRKWSMEDLTDFTLLDEVLNASAFIHYIEDAGAKMFGEQNKKLLYEIGLKLRTEQPISLSENQKNLIKKYLRDKSVIIRTEEIVDFELTEKQKIYQNTDWIIYFYEREDNKGRYGMSFARHNQSLCSSRYVRTSIN